MDIPTGLANFVIDPLLKNVILNGDNMLLSTTLRVLAPWALMVAKAMSLAETLGKRLIKLALTTYTMGNVFWVISSNRYCAADQLWGLA